MTKIIIIGAGISGLVAGLLLRQQGYDISIYEKRTAIEPLGGGLGIWPNGVQVLMKLACAEKIKSLLGVINQDLFADASGNTLVESPRELFLQVNGYPIMNVCRSELHQILADEFGRQNIIFGVKCVDLQQRSSKVIARFDNNLEAQADLLIGADGAYSTVRKILFPEAKLIYSGYLHFLGVLRYSSLQQAKHNFIIGKNRYSIQFPVSQGRHVFYHVLPYQQGKIQHVNARKERILLFKGWSQEVDSLLDTYEKLLTQNEFSNQFYCEEAYTMPMLEKWHDGRIVLLGDAAHPMGSVMGFGAGCALEDCDIFISNFNNKKTEETMLAYEQHQMPRISRFYQYEKKITDFILYGNDEKYDCYISDLKNMTHMEFNRELIDCLKN